ncbi:glycosyltransferase [Nocardia sp. NPDC060259]|uniref:glycosyltransferase n=1 Tax=Nocardia sp. NPDC060259 TaxID=3347088 RepID=UPI0036570B19
MNDTTAGGILFAANPDSGLINPLLTIAGELARRGEPGLWFASTDDRKGDIENQGGLEPIRFVSVGARKPELDPSNWSDETYRALGSGSMLSRFSAFLDAVSDADDVWTKYSTLMEQLDRLRPALVVADSSSTWAMDAALMHGIPYVMTVPIPISSVYFERLPLAYPAPFSGLPRNMNLAQRIANISFYVGSRLALFKPSLMRKAAPLARRRKEAGVPNPHGLPSKYSDLAHEVLSFTVADFEVPFEAMPEHLRLVGAMIPADQHETSSADNELDAWLDACESIVYIGFGTIMRLDRAQLGVILDVVEALGPEHHVLWKLPADQQALLPARLPENLRIEAWVPSQLGVLAHPNVKVFFNHGGGNGVNEGLFFGKPLLVMPFWVDCHDYAARVVESGAGLAVPHALNLRSADIQRALIRLLNEPEFREKAGALGESHRSAGGVFVAGDLIATARQEACSRPC